MVEIKNATINPENIDDRCCQSAFQHYKEIRSQLERVPNTKQFINLCNQKDIVYPTIINKDIYTLFEKNNPQIALIMLHVDVNVWLSAAGAHIQK